MDMCRVTNLDKKRPFSMMYEGNRFTIKPGKAAVVPRYAVNLWFGDPDTRNDPNDRNRYYRQNEWNRLRVKYGAYENDDLWEQNKPNIQVFDLDDNELITVVQDPTGDSLTSGPVGPSRIEMDMAAQLADMERQMEAMRRALADVEAGEAGGLGRTRTEGQAADDSGAKNDLDDGGSESQLPPEPVKVTEDKPNRVRGGSSK